MNGQQSLFFQVDYPEIVDNIKPRHRFMSAYEQRLEPPDRQWQYLLFAAEPYETIGFKVWYCVEYTFSETPLNGHPSRKSRHAGFELINCVRNIVKLSSFVPL